MVPGERVPLFLTSHHGTLGESGQVGQLITSLITPQHYSVANCGQTFLTIFQNINIIQKLITGSCFDSFLDPILHS